MAKELKRVILTYIYALIIIILSQSDLKHVAREETSALCRERGGGKRGKGSAMAAFMSSLEI